MHASSGASPPTPSRTPASPPPTSPYPTSSGSYPDEEFVCQYRESHLDFLHRWFEREGLYYYFEHEDSDSGTEKLIIVDDRPTMHLCSERASSATPLRRPRHERG
ncbi:MAG: phage late control D family protein [Polyangiaceae bacterium]